MWGEGWHNNHHAKPNNKIFGERAWELDIGGYFIKLIEKNFGSMPSKPVAPYTFEKETPITQKIVKEIVGPDAAN